MDEENILGPCGLPHWVFYTVSTVYENASLMPIKI